MTESATVKVQHFLRIQLNLNDLGWCRVGYGDTHVIYTIAHRKQVHHVTAHNSKRHENETFDSKGHASGKFFWKEYLYCEGRGEENNSRNMSVKRKRTGEITYDHIRQAIGRLCVIARHAIPHLFRPSDFMTSACHCQHEHHE